MKKISSLMAILAMTVFLQGCITKIVTVPVKAAYTVTKGVVKGTVRAVEAVMPDKEDEKKD